MTSRLKFVLLILINYFNWSHASEQQRSLVFVCDATDSMQDDLNALHEGSEEILNSFANKKDQPFGNYVLSVFRDRGLYLNQHGGSYDASHY
jgi:hypothetical protein